MKKLASAQEIIQAFEQFSPKSLAVEGDKIGLQVGTLNKRVRKVMVALDVLDEVVDEAIEEGVDLIIAHHPLIFRPIKKLIIDQGQGKIITKLIKHDIAVYAAHTNLDVTNGGVNDLMADALGLIDTEVLVPTYEDELKKFIVFVPEDHAQIIREVLGTAGAGHIGNYSHCTYNTNGMGTFLPGEQTDPFIGTKGKIEEVNEVKIETIVPRSKIKAVVSAMLKAHPYEEPAYDILPLENKGQVLGLGRIGLLQEPMTLSDFAKHVKQSFDVKGVRVVGSLDSIVKKVAVLGGDGNKYWQSAKFKGADVYVTGDMYYHVAHDAMMENLNIVDPGHNVEKVMKEGVRNILQTFIEEKKYETLITTSKLNTDPFQFV
ncbi:Nif3-like dinuclear metal center hexameric protein [Bacillus solimangrovi]|uniref:GTP cyclohydrolase 1 type 2 homolog n=1 Tax=Bacillus solimangrovi TaxID=1305675 RepID=A0A1E5LI29_9BACI|nr:Nif3-like dinuclear metal center hexameric protein [Bacillus solimangrovi]OEH93718.1 Nif3-like dinuclear metal center hexameric protein [Bacillus solimangrovi]